MNILEAVESGNIENVTQCIRNGHNINTIAHLGTSILIISLQRGFVEIADLLIENGADVNLKGYLDNNPLELAIQKGFFASADKMLAKGADINILCYRGACILYQLLNDKNIEGVNYLLMQSGIDVNIKAPFCLSPLGMALENELYEQAEKIIIAGADINELDYYGRSLLCRAIEKNDITAADLLINKGADVKLKCGWSKQSPLYKSIEKKLYNIAKKIIEVSKDADELDKDGLSLMYKFLIMKDVDGANFLFENGANLKFKNSHGEGILSTTLLQGFIELADKIINAGGSDINEINIFGQSPLLRALLSQNINVIYFLLDRNVNTYLEPTWGLCSDQINAFNSICKQSLDISFKIIKKDNSPTTFKSTSKVNITAYLNPIIAHAVAQKYKEDHELAGYLVHQKDVPLSLKEMLIKTITESSWANRKAAVIAKHHYLKEMSALKAANYAALLTDESDAKDIHEAESYSDTPLAILKNSEFEAYEISLNHLNSTAATTQNSGNVNLAGEGTSLSVVYPECC